MAAWPIELIEGIPELRTALAREAEARGLWDEAAVVWKKQADATTDLIQRADHLVRGAIDAGVGGDATRREELLLAAEALDPQSVRLRLERFDDTSGAVEQLEFLSELATEDVALSALIAAQRSLAYLLLPDLEGAEVALAEAIELEADSVAVRVARINLDIQKARLALVGDRAFAMADVLKARDDALALRRHLLEMGRWEESSRLLMLAAEVMALLRDPGGAKAILERASTEEPPQRRLVLRSWVMLPCEAVSPTLALSFIEDAAETDAIARIRATAEADLPGPQRQAALERLEGLARSDGPEREFAAASRLLACLPPGSAEWSEEMAEVLADGPHAPMATRLRVIAMVENDPEKAKALAKDLPDEAWAAEMRLRVGGQTGDTDMTRGAAVEFLGYGPDASGLMLVAQGFASVRDLDRAGEILIGLVHDPNCPPSLRSDAFDTLMFTLADRDRWREAKQIWNEWADFVLKEIPGGDTRVSAWHVRVAHHNRPGTPKR